MCGGDRVLLGFCSVVGGVFMRVDRVGFYLGFSQVYVEDPVVFCRVFCAVDWP